jgi:hypothetical protein
MDSEEISKYLMMGSFTMVQPRRESLVCKYCNGIPHIYSNYCPVKGDLRTFKERLLEELPRLIMAMYISAIIILIFLSMTR